MKFSRQHIPEPKGMFLQVDSKMKVDVDGTVTHIGDAPVDPEKWYDIATSQLLLEGMDNITPLVDFAKAHPERIPNPRFARPAKELIVEECAETVLSSIAPASRRRLSLKKQSDISPSASGGTRTLSGELTRTLEQSLDAFGLTDRHSALAQKVVSVWKKKASRTTSSSGKGRQAAAGWGNAALAVKGGKGSRSKGGKGSGSSPPVPPGRGRAAGD